MPSRTMTGKSTEQMTGMALAELSVPAESENSQEVAAKEKKKEEEMMMGRKDKIPPKIYKTSTHSLIICSRSFKVGIDREHEVSG